MATLIAKTVGEKLLNRRTSLAKTHNLKNNTRTIQAKAKVALFRQVKCTYYFSVSFPKSFNTTFCLFSDYLNTYFNWYVCFEKVYNPS